MAKQKKKIATPSAGHKIIAINKKARFEFHLEERFEAGLVLEGWEVKSLREGRINFVDSHVFLRDAEAFLLNARIDPLPTVSTHFRPEPTRTRKLLMHKREIVRLVGAVERQGYALVPTAMYWKSGRAKLEIALAKGKKLHDKRATEKARDWGRDKQRLLKSS